MQIFEAFEVKEFPYMGMKEIIEGESIRDIIIDKNEDKVFLIVDHDLKRIWTYNGERSSFKVQIYGGILAGMMRVQLKLFYRVVPLNNYSKDSKVFQEVLDKKIGGGRAKAIEKDDFSEDAGPINMGDLCVHPSLKVNKALEILEELPKPQNFIRKFLIIGGNIYTEEETTEGFLQKEETSNKPVMLGALNRGFNLFEGNNYATRVVIRDRNIQGIELFVDKSREIEPLELKIPILFEERFSNTGEMDTIVAAFQIPEELPEESTDQDQNQIEDSNDTTD